MERVARPIIVSTLSGSVKMRMTMPRLWKRPWSLPTHSDPFVGGREREGPWLGNRLRPFLFYETAKMADGPARMPKWQPCQFSECFLKPILDHSPIARYNGMETVGATMVMKVVLIIIL